MKLNESDIKKIIREVINEGSYNNLKRRPVLNITDDQVLAWYFFDVEGSLEGDYEVEFFNGKEIPDYIKPYMDDIVDAIDFEELNDVLWEEIFQYVWRSSKLDEVKVKLANELESRGKAWR
jgi:hypothetical protein